MKQKAFIADGDTLVMLKIEDGPYQMVIRKSKLTNVPAHVFLDITAQFLLHGFLRMGVSGKRAAGFAKLGGNSTNELPMSKYLLNEVRAYSDRFNTSVSALMNNALVKMQPNIIRMMPINPRRCASVSKELFALEQTGELSRHKSSEEEEEAA